MLEQEWQGRRVSVRRADADGRTRDVVGDLLTLSAGRAVIETGAGATVEIPRDRITAARLVAPSTADVLAVEAVAAQGWRPFESRWLDGWLLRASEGMTRRANSVLPLRQLRRALPEAVDEARAWYAERGLPLRVSAPLPARSLLDAALREDGWAVLVEAHVLTARLDALAARPDTGLDVEVRSAPDDAWWAAHRPHGPVLLDSERRLLTGHPRAAFARCGDAVARGAVDDGWLGVTAVLVPPQQRRQGRARALLLALARWALDEHGARRGYLQVEAGNTAALALYEGLGLTLHHDYRILEHPPG